MGIRTDNDCGIKYKSLLSIRGSLYFALSLIFYSVSYTLIIQTQWSSCHKPENPFLIYFVAYCIFQRWLKQYPSPSSRTERNELTDQPRFMLIFFYCPWARNVFTFLNNYAYKVMKNMWHIYNFYLCFWFLQKQVETFFIHCWPSKFLAALTSEDPFDLRDLVSIYT